MSIEQQMAFNLNLTAKVGGTKVTYGGVGVVALALSMLLEQVAQQVQSQRPTELNITSQPKHIFGISTSSIIGSIIHDYIRLIPGIANDEESMAENTELYDNGLKLELLDHYERMTTKKRMSSESMQQWLTGAAFHLHMRIHQVRLHSVPLGSVQSLRLSYKTGWNRLVQGYTAYLHRNIQETEAPEPSSASIIKNSTSFNTFLFQFSQSANFPKLKHPNSTDKCCKTGGTSEDLVLKETKAANESSVIRINTNKHNFTDHSLAVEEEDKLGLLVIEPLRNMSHNVHHHPCESVAIQQSLVTRIINSMDLERSRNFFLYPEKVFLRLIRQRSDFMVTTV
ncbi:uncharacterized protein LOC114476078 isoform X2 [Gouania willdenowi]|nr:uncharacterized protein LOC114476078 isoform X2 [Gouania willdenowi]XP_028323138.1 uncharacterized protein LOC114476078 isoform X2 [Gouania willdenowi]